MKIEPAKRYLFKFRFEGERSQVIDVDSFEEASVLYTDSIAALGLGYSACYPTVLRDARTNKLVGHVSYNGRVWAGKATAWKSGAVPLWEPGMKEVAS